MNRKVLTLLVVLLLAAAALVVLPVPAAYAQGPVMQSIHPPSNTLTASLTSNVSITYDQPISAATVSEQTFAVHAMQTGLLTQTFGVEGGTDAGLCQRGATALHVSLVRSQIVVQQSCFDPQSSLRIFRQRPEDGGLSLSPRRSGQERAKEKGDEEWMSEFHGCAL